MRVYADVSAGTDPAYQSIHVINNPQSAVHYSLHFYLTPGTTLAPGTYTAGNIYSDDARFPNVAFDLAEMKGGDGKAFLTKTDGSGTVTVTSVTGGLVEGTFAFNLEGMSGERAITNGAFQFRMPRMEKK